MATWSDIETLAVGNQLRAAFLRRFRCRELPGDVLEDMEGIAALTGSVVQTFHQELLNIGLPFRVHVRVTSS